MTKRGAKARPLIGWREWVRLPDLAPVPIKAKIDTGARTSTLHAPAMSIHDHDGEAWVTFDLHPVQRSSRHTVTVRCPVVAHKQVRSSTGHAETRPVIRTAILLGDHRYSIDVTLTSRDEMGFRLLLGRAAVRRRFWVDPGRSFLHPIPNQTASQRGVEHTA